MSEEAAPTSIAILYAVKSRSMQSQNTYLLCNAKKK